MFPLSPLQSGEGLHIFSVLGSSGCLNISAKLLFIPGSALTDVPKSHGKAFDFYVYFSYNFCL